MCSYREARFSISYPARAFFTTTSCAYLHAGAQLERLLSEAQHLTRMNLASNMLGDAGALALARTMPYCHWLQTLDLRSNNIGEQVRLA